MSDSILQYNSNNIIKREKNCSIILIVYGVAFGFLSYIGSPFATLFSLFFILAIALYDKYLALAVYVCTMVVAPEFTNIELAISMMEVLGIGIVIMSKTKGKIKKLLITDVAFVFFVLFGLVLGLDTQLITVFLYAFYLFTSVLIARTVYDTNDNLILLALLVAGIIVSAITLHLYMTGHFEALRINYNGNSKDLSTVIVIPVFMAINKLLDYKNHKSRMAFLIYMGVFFVILPLLLLTYSRGVTLSLIVASGFLYTIYSKDLGFKKIILLVLIGAALYYMVGNMKMSYRMWFDNLEGGNGRTDIWRMYFKYMGDKGDLSLLFGLGTASQKDIIGWYPHSVILAHFFHFGIIGLLFILFQTMIPLLNLYKRRKTFPFHFCLIVLTVMMYFPHGSYNEQLFWVIIGLSFGIIYKRNLKIQKK